jgi:NAD(P)-dependent dehydrogenase (short-subunit alcohol dehydrogenase family)
MQERFLEGRTALVTGSVQGIGLAIGKALASAGARLAVHGLATREQADAAVRTMRKTGAPDARFFVPHNATCAAGNGETQPSRRTSRPEEIGSLALWLAHPTAHNITGAAIPIDGGWTVQ